MNDSRKCPKCVGELEEGYLVRVDSAKTIVWRMFGVNLRSHKVFAYRCRSCGYVELYARE
jgi:predicted nucleic-acid-binding Zn-ribbon protein